MTPTDPADTLAPAPLDSRYLTLDALRGFAVMGILAMNIVGFAMPMLAYLSPAVYGGTDGPDSAAWLVSFLLFDGKMRGLFSLLFGASLMLIAERAEAGGKNSAAVHYSRMAWLAVFGLAHFYLIWIGDILFLYAVIGCIAFLFRRMDADRLIKWALIVYIAGFVILTTLFSDFLFLQAAATGADPVPEAIAAFDDFLAASGFTAVDTARELAAYRSDWTAIVSYRVTEHGAQPFTSLWQNGFETLPMMLLGMALMKNGFLTGRLEPWVYSRLALGLLPVGFGLTAIVAAVVLLGGFDLIVTLNAAIAWTYPPRLMLTLGYAALLVLLVRRFSESGWMAHIAAAGRAALTNYLGTSLVMTTIFYGYGFGFYGEIGRAELYLFVPAAWMLMLSWPKPWLARFRYGPLEWLWRSFARLRLQPMRRDVKTIAT